MNHKITGKGRPIIILRGLGRTFDYWLDFEVELSKQFKVIMINLPGTDDENELTPITIKGTAQKVVEKIKELKEELGEPPYDIFGLSLGGLTTLSIAYYYPKLVNRIAVASISITQLSYKRMYTLPFLKLMLMQIEPSGPVYPHRTFGKYLVSSDYLHGHQRIVETWDHFWHRQNLSKKNFMRQLVAALFSLTPKMLSRIKARTLVLSGEEDSLVPSDNSQLIHECIKDSVHITLQRTGHDVTTEHPKLITEMLKAFTSNIDLDEFKDKFQTVKEAPEILQLKLLSKKFP